MDQATEKTDAFDEDLFEARLEALKDTQDSIQLMSAWCLQHRAAHKKIVACWLNVFKRVRVEHRLTLFYLANDVIQYSKRKRFEFVESWATALQRATTMVRDEKVKSKILRIFNIWEQRDIYSEEYLSDLCGLLNITPPKKSRLSADASDEVQNLMLITSVRECVDLSNATDKSFKKLPKAPQLDSDLAKQRLKDRTQSENLEKELDRYKTYVEAYIKNLQAEMKTRKTVLANLDSAMKFYTNQRGEVKVVVTAYKNFGSRIKLVKKKVSELSPNLPSPIPSPDINAPSPEPDTDLQLPDDQSAISINLFKNTINGYSSYLDGNLPFDINDFKCDEMPSKSSSQRIEVIGSRSDDESYSSGVEYYKPSPINPFPSETNVSIPGLNPLPVPPVQADYASVARSSQYESLMSPTNSNQFASSHNSIKSYPALANYNSNSSYHTNPGESNAYGNVSSVGPGDGMQPLMPPPPMPPSTLAGIGGGTGGNTQSDPGNAFNSSWNINLSWPSLDNSPNPSSASYAQNPMDREPQNINPTDIEYGEHGSNLLPAQDVDHRQLHLPAFNIGAKLGLSKDKTRQLDIGHRNLISLTGSPGASENDKNFQTNQTGDVDYRTVLAPAKRISSNADVSSEPAVTEALTSSNMMAPHSATKKSSPQKNNANSSAETQNEDTGGSATQYEPTDMVVDMDMSDEDLDEIFRAVNEQATIEQQEPAQDSLIAGEEGTQPTLDEVAECEQTGRPALLETPIGYLPPNAWDSTACASMPGYPGADAQPQHPGWNQSSMPWNESEDRGGNVMCVPPPPRPPFPLQFPYPNSGAGGGSGEYSGGGIRGRGRGFIQNQYRNFPRQQRGGHGYFNRGRVGPMTMRGTFRGKFRGNNSWV